MRPALQTKDVLRALRKSRGLSQAQLAQQLYLTRQAVSRWETGETLPGPDMLLQLSRLFDVSVNTLLGSPKQLLCQCCGMPLEDAVISREADGSFNEAYCKWCYDAGAFAYTSIQQLIDFLAPHMATAQWPEQEVRRFLQAQLPQLDHWRTQETPK